MDKDTFDILDFLSNQVYRSMVDIRDVVNKIFPYRKGMSQDEFDAEKRAIIRFLEGMEKPIYMVNFNYSRDIGEYYEGRNIWFEKGKLNNVFLLQLNTVFKDNLTTHQITDAIERITKTLQNEFPRIKQIFIEPVAG